MAESAYEQRKLDLIEEVRTAFDGVAREGGVSLSEAWVIDDRGSAKERAEARQQDTEARWQDVSEEDIAYGSVCLHFFDAVGFRYYLPAYIIWVLRHMDNKDPSSLSYSY